jgi:hypothetical protein
LIEVVEDGVEDVGESLVFEEKVNDVDEESCLAVKCTQETRDQVHQNVLEFLVEFQQHEQLARAQLV